MQSAVTRCVLVPCSVLLIPPAVMAALKNIHFLPTNSGGKIAIELAVIFASLQVALPGSLAVYPQVFFS
jgi:hypothetical protein